MAKRFIKPGDRRGLLVVVGEGGRDSRGVKLWECLCECGNKCSRLASHINSKKMPSCGCFSNKAKGLHARAHGMTGSPEFVSWKSAKARCFNPGSASFSDYGGRGITMCTEWKESFERFFEDMGQRPPGMSLERIVVNGNYCPENCVWADSKQQGRNRRPSVRIPWKGEVKTTQEIAAELGISTGAAYQRWKRGTLNANTGA